LELITKKSSSTDAFFPTSNVLQIPFD